MLVELYIHEFWSNYLYKLVDKLDEKMFVKKLWTKLEKKSTLRLEIYLISQPFENMVVGSLFIDLMY